MQLYYINVYKNRIYSIYILFFLQRKWQVNSSSYYFLQCATRRLGNKSESKSRNLQLLTHIHRNFFFQSVFISF